MTEPSTAIDTRPADLWARVCLVCGALLGLATVAMGAVAAHLPDSLLASGGRALLRTAVGMQGWHIPALLACGLLLERRVGWSAAVLRASAACLLLGIACFCAGLYTLAFAGPGLAGHLAPFGGSILMLAWLLLAIGCAGRPTQ